MSNSPERLDDFDGIDLGDARREKRIQMMAAQAEVGSSGTIAGTFPKSADRQGAYRAAANEAIEVGELRKSAARTAFSRASGSPFVFVPCDQSTLTLSSVDEDEDSEFGPTGNRWSSDQGVQVMSAIIVDPRGVTLGVAGQVYWAREEQEQRSRAEDIAAKGKRAPRRKKAVNRPIGEKESAHWGTVMEQSMESAREASFDGKLWFQLDAGADFAHLLASATLLEHWLTVRVKNPRLLFGDEGLLREEVLKSAPTGTTVVSVPANKKHPAREATLEFRYVPVVLKLKPRGDGGTIPAPLFAVHAVEVSAVPNGADSIDWLLLTNKEGATLKDAQAVIHGYTRRWRIEEVHRAWKSVTKVEESELESLHGFSLWATILFSIAVRIERLKYFSRAEPDAPATVELEPHEVKALHVLRETHKKQPVDQLTIGVAVRWIADLGGYMNPHKGPPGSVTIARGLHHLRVFAEGLRAGAKK